MSFEAYNNKKYLTNTNPFNKLPFDDTKKTKSFYLEDEETQKIYKITSEIPKKIPRIEEVKLFIEKIKLKKVGVAFCKGLQNEAEKIIEFLNSNNDIEFHSVICAYEEVNKSIANSEGTKNHCNITCNPIGQASFLNNLNTELNITIGLCIGHDILFSKYSKAPITNLVVKDRVYKHKPLNFFPE